jgi:hypothetical protein
LDSDPPVIFGDEFGDAHHVSCSRIASMNQSLTMMNLTDKARLTSH